MNAHSELAGKTILVIGGTKNIGLAIARRADAAGARLVIAGRDEAKANDVAATLSDARGLGLDVTDEGDIVSAATTLDSVDHVVITAAAHHNVPVAELEHHLVVRAFEAKVIGPLLVAKHFAPKMAADGSFILFSGVAAWKPAPGRAVMNITNGAVAFAAAQLATELAPIRVNAISPGIVDSGTYDAMPSDAKRSLLDGAAQGTLVGRFGRNDDVVEAAMWLLTASFVSGETIHVEGGARVA